MKLSFVNNIFSVTLTSAARPVGNVRQECEIRAQELYKENNKIMLGLSGGVDCQVVLHSFASQNIPLKCVFFYLTDCNDFEFSNVKTLQAKYNLDLSVIELDPNSIKDQVIDEYQQTGIPPYQLMHKHFLSMLPEEYTFIQGLDGPDLVKQQSTGKWYIMQTANSFVNSRVRAMEMLKRSGKIISWEKSPELFYSIISDDVVTSYMYAHRNIVDNGLSYANDRPIPLIDHYDLYIKPIMYGKYWKNELEYFPKYQGPEKIDWIMNRQWHRYDQNVAYISYQEAIDILSTPGQQKTYFQRSQQSS
jgi:hypothetical protein